MTSVAFLVLLVFWSLFGVLFTLTIADRFPSRQPRWWTLFHSLALLLACGPVIWVLAVFMLFEGDD